MNKKLYCLIGAIVIAIASAFIINLSTEKIIYQQTIELHETKEALLEKKLELVESELHQLQEQYGEVFWLLYETIENNNPEPAKNYFEEIEKNTIDGII